jgi:hypothetical protein
MLRNARNPKTREIAGSSGNVRTALVRDKEANTYSGRALIGAYGSFLRHPVYYLRDGFTPERPAACQSSTT